VTKSKSAQPHEAGQVDESRRAAVLGMAKGAAYVAPVVISFAMQGLSVREAHAYVTNT